MFFFLHLNNRTDVSITVIVSVNLSDVEFLAYYKGLLAIDIERFSLSLVRDTVSETIKYAIKNQLLVINFPINILLYHTFYFFVAWADRWANATRRSKVEKAKKHIQEYKSKRDAKGKRWFDFTSIH